MLYTRKPDLPAPVRRQGYHQIETAFRAYDGAKLTWRRVMGQHDWQEWVLIRVNGKGPLV